MVLIDLSKPHYLPEHNIVSNLAYSAQASDVETVFVDGRILYDKGEFKPGQGKSCTILSGYVNGFSADAITGQ